MTSPRLATYSVSGSTKYGAVVEGGIVDQIDHDRGTLLDDNAVEACLRAFRTGRAFLDYESE